MEKEEPLERFINWHDHYCSSENRYGETALALIVIAEEIQALRYAVEGSPQDLRLQRELERITAEEKRKIHYEQP